MAEAAARDHRHIGAAGRDDRRQHQRDIVADAAGRMLVGDRAGQVRPVEHVAGIAHGERQRHRLVAAHAVEEDRHGERRDLAFGDRAGGDAGDELGDLARRQRLAVALLADDFLGEHQRCALPLEGRVSPT